MTSLVPAPTPALFASFYADASNDTPQQNILALLSPHDIDLNNPGTNLTPATVRQQIAEAGAQRLPIVLVLLVNGRLQPYFLPFRRSQAAGEAPDPATDNKIYAIDGELIRNEGTLVELPDALWNQLPNQVQVSTVAHIQTQLTADASQNFMMGPFNAGDGNTEVVKTRYINIIPFKYAALFIQGVTPRYYFETILPQIVSDGNENAMLPLTKTAQVALTRRAVGDDTSVLQVPSPTCPPRHEGLTKYKHALLISIFPLLDNAAAVNAAANPIAQGIVNLHQQRELQYQEEKQEKADKAAKSVSGWLGVENLELLLTFCCVPQEALLPPIWRKLAAASQKDRLSVLQGAIRKELRSMGDGRLAESYCLNPNLLLNLIMMSWSMVTPDSLETGCLGNLWLFGDTDVEQQQRLMKQLLLIQAGGAAPSLADIQQLLKMKINMPGEEESLRYVRRLEAVMRAVLPVGHPATVFVAHHYRCMKEFDQDWTNHAGHLGLKGVLHLAWLSSRLSQYFRKQSYSSTVVSLPDPEDIKDKIERQETWWPILSLTFIERNNLRSLIRLDKQLETDDATAATEMSSLSGGFSLPGSQTSGGSRGSGLGSSAGDPPENVRVENTHFNSALFLTYKMMPVKSRALRDKIISGALEPLPKSKANASAPMCLSWHTKGQCNTGCKLTGDHTSYSEHEYVPLVKWCSDNYNKGE